MEKEDSCIYLTKCCHCALPLPVQESEMSDIGGRGELYLPDEVLSLRIGNMADSEPSGNRTAVDVSLRSFARLHT